VFDPQKRQMENSSFVRVLIRLFFSFFFFFLLFSSFFFFFFFFLFLKSGQLASQCLMTANYVFSSFLLLFHSFLLLFAFFPLFFFLFGCSIVHVVG
jgi:hypothetical protein